MIAIFSFAYFLTGFLMFLLFWRYLIIDKDCGFERFVSLLILIAWPLAILVFIAFSLWEALVKIGLMVMKK